MEATYKIAIVKYRRRTHGAAGAKLPNRSFRRTDPDVAPALPCERCL